MDTGSRSPIKKSTGSSPLNIRNSRSLPLKHIQKIIGNYTRRSCNTKLIPQKAQISKTSNTSKFLDFTSLEDLSDPIRSDEELLNTLRSSPPKAEISLLSEVKEDDVETLKKIVKEERLKYVTLERSYRELLNQFTQNEVNYKRRICELEYKIMNSDKRDLVSRDEHLKLAQRVEVLESILVQRTSIK